MLPPPRRGACLLGLAGLALRTISAVPIVHSPQPGSASAVLPRKTTAPTSYTAPTESTLNRVKGSTDHLGKREALQGDPRTPAPKSASSTPPPLMWTTPEPGVSVISFTDTNPLTQVWVVMTLSELGPSEVTIESTTTIARNGQMPEHSPSIGIVLPESPAWTATLTKGSPHAISLDASSTTTASFDELTTFYTTYGGTAWVMDVRAGDTTQSLPTTTSTTTSSSTDWPFGSGSSLLSTSLGDGGAAAGFRQSDQATPTFTFTAGTTYTETLAGETVTFTIATDQTAATSLSNTMINGVFYLYEAYYMAATPPQQETATSGTDISTITVSGSPNEVVTTSGIAGSYTLTCPSGPSTIFMTLGAGTATQVIELIATTAVDNVGRRDAMRSPYTLTGLASIATTSRLSNQEREVSRSYEANPAATAVASRPTSKPINAPTPRKTAGPEINVLPETISGRSAYRPGRRDDGEGQFWEWTASDDGETAVPILSTTPGPGVDAITFSDSDSRNPQSIVMTLPSLALSATTIFSTMKVAKSGDMPKHDVSMAIIRAQAPEEDFHLTAGLSYSINPGPGGAAMLGSESALTTYYTTFAGIVDIMDFEKVYSATTVTAKVGDGSIVVDGPAGPYTVDIPTAATTLLTTTIHDTAVQGLELVAEAKLTTQTEIGTFGQTSIVTNGVIGPYTVTFPTGPTTFLTTMTSATVVQAVEVIAETGMMASSTLVASGMVGQVITTLGALASYTLTLPLTPTTTYTTMTVMVDITPTANMFQVVELIASASLPAAATPTTISGTYRQAPSTIVVQGSNEIATFPTTWSGPSATPIAYTSTITVSDTAYTFVVAVEAQSAGAPTITADQKAPVVSLSDTFPGASEMFALSLPAQGTTMTSITTTTSVSSMSGVAAHVDTYVIVVPQLPQTTYFPIIGAPYPVLGSYFTLSPVPTESTTLYWTSGGSVAEYDIRGTPTFSLAPGGSYTTTDGAISLGTVVAGTQTTGLATFTTSVNSVPMPYVVEVEPPSALQTTPQTITVSGTALESPTLITVPDMGTYTVFFPYNEATVPITLVTKGITQALAVVAVNPTGLSTITGTYGQASTSVTASGIIEVATFPPFTQNVQPYAYPTHVVEDGATYSFIVAVETVKAG